VDPYGLLNVDYKSLENCGGKKAVKKWKRIYKTLVEISKMMNVTGFTRRSISVRI